MKDKELWDRWVETHPDVYSSVHRSPDSDQLVRIAEDVIQKLDLKDGDELLDVGCGSGILLVELCRRRKLRVLGADFSEKQIELAQRNFPHLDFLVASVESLPLPKASFSKILCYSVLGHSPDWKAAASELLRILKPGGQILLGDLPDQKRRLHFYWQIISSVPLVLKQRRFLQKTRYALQSCPWRWLPIDEIVFWIREKGSKVERLNQPSGHRQYGNLTGYHRFDLLITQRESSVPSAVKKPRAVLIGLDGAPYRVIERASSQGRLPHLKKLIDQGCFGKLRSTILPISPIAWTTLATGVNAGKHGVFDFGEREAKSYKVRVVSSASWKAKPFWEILGDAGFRVGIFNVPVTYPPTPVKGYLISGLLTPNDKVPFTYPVELSQRVRSEVPDYSVLTSGTFSLGQEERFIKELLRSIEQREKAILFLLKSEPTDFLFCVFMELDHLHHKMGKYLNQAFRGAEAERATHVALFEKVYERIDEAVGRILEVLDPKTAVWVVSDHGATALKRAIRINQWLHEEGYLALKRGWRMRTKIFLARRKWIERGVKLASGFGFGKFLRSLPWWLQDAAATSFFSFEDIDWSQTKAFAYGKYGQIYLNVKGREPSGVVETGAEYEALRREISEKLLEMRDPGTGERIIEQVFRREELYEGPYADLAADLVFEFKDYAYDSTTEFGFGADGIFREPEFSDSGTHDPEGVLIAKGSGIRQGKTLSESRLENVAPSLLHFLGFPPGSAMDGRLLQELFEAGFKSAVSVASGQQAETKSLQETPYPFDETQEEELRERLKTLGYLG